MSSIITPQMRQLAEEAQYDFDARAPSVLLPYQQRWIADESEVKVDEKSRRVGMSWTAACESALIAAAASGRDQWYIGYTKDMAVEFILDAAQWAEHYQSVADAIEASEEVWIDGDEKKSVFVFSIKFASGHRITALSSQPRNLRSKQGDVILDEFAFHTDPRGLLKAAMALLIWGGRLRIISTHNGDDNEFNVLINDVRAERKPYKVHRTTFDDALNEGLYRRVCLRLGKPFTEREQKEWADNIRAFYGDDAEEELDCVPKNGSGAFLSRELVERAMRQGWPVLRDQRQPDFTWKPEHVRDAAILDWCNEHLLPLLQALPKNEMGYVGGDFGRTGDLSSFFPLMQRQNLTRYVPFIVELRGMPFRQQLQILWFIIDHLARFAGAALDSRGLGSQMAEETAQKYGPDVIIRVMATQQWYLEHLPPYKAAFEDGLIELPADADVLADHRIPRVIKGIPQVPELRTTDAQKRKRHADTFIAGALAWFVSRMLMGSNAFGYQAAPARSSRWDAVPHSDDSDFVVNASGAY